MIGDDDLRDLFAMFAMNGLISRGSAWEPKEVYEIADVMMEARNKKESYAEGGIARITKKRAPTRKMD